MCGENCLRKVKDRCGDCSKKLCDKCDEYNSNENYANCYSCQFSSPSVKKCEKCSEDFPYKNNVRKYCHKCFFKLTPKKCKNCRFKITVNYVNKEGNNHGKLFYKCELCKLFTWITI